MAIFDLIAFLERRVEAARKAESIDEYRAIVDELLECVKEFQKENARLEDENTQLKDTKTLESEVENKYKYPIVTRKSDDYKVAYCGSCYGANQMFIPIGGRIGTGMGELYTCGDCKGKFIVESGDDVFERA